MKDLYSILDLEPTATNEEIKYNYHFLLHAWHPDKFPDVSQKLKAEEKIRDINYAYEILINPESRQTYDVEAGYKSSNSVPPKKYIFTDEFKEEIQYCDSCGCRAKTRKVKFYQNIGMLIVRQHKSVEGNLCKNCINYYFWEFTGITLLFGWWGVKSFIVTPFIVISNIFHFISSIGLKKPDQISERKPSPFWIISTIGVIAALIIYAYVIIDPFSASPSYVDTPTSEPQTSIAIVPTKTKSPTRIPTSTRQTPRCYEWSEITKNMIGKNVCVYGKIYDTRFVGTNTFQVLFSKNSYDFFMAAGTYYYEVNSGDCVYAEGEILKSSAGVPYMDIDDVLYECESWMN
jgi:hypothetical protein